MIVGSTFTEDQSKLASCPSQVPLLLAVGLPRTLLHTHSASIESPEFPFHLVGACSLYHIWVTESKRKCNKVGALSSSQL